jgi:hypothetical protein
MLTVLSESTYVCGNFVRRSIRELETHYLGTLGEMGVAIS